MRGSSHTCFTLAGAALINSAIYAFHPQPVAGDWEGLVHSAGQPLRWLDLVFFWQHPLAITTNGVPQTLFYKFLFYGMLVAAAMLPDQIEKRRRADSTQEYRFTPHRGPTHSIVMVVLLVASFSFLYVFAMTYLRLYHVVVAPGIIRTLTTLATAILFAFVLHILADMFTRDGVKLLWPGNTDIGIPPVRQLRPTVDSQLELIWLWLLVFVTGMLFAFGVVGI